MDPNTTVTAGSSGGSATMASTGGTASSTGATASSTGVASSVTARWPDNWREQYAGGDEKKVSRLSRYASLDGALDALFAAQNRISSGELKPVLPKDATPEQLKAYRAELGVPEDPAKYDLKLKQGRIIGDEDKPVIASFLKEAALPLNLRGEDASKVVDWYYDEVERQSEVQAQALEKAKKDTEDNLRAEWGQDYRPNQNAIAAILDANLSTNDADLRKVLDNTVAANPGFAKLLAGLARQINPVTTLVGIPANQPQAIDAEISDIEKLMRENRQAYDKDEKKQARLRELYGARERLKAR